jgi:hypothetical protein
MRNCKKRRSDAAFRSKPAFLMPTRTKVKSMRRSSILPLQAMRNSTSCIGLIDTGIKRSDCFLVLTLHAIQIQELLCRTCVYQVQSVLHKPDKKTPIVLVQDDTETSKLLVYSIFNPLSVVQCSRPSSILQTTRANTASPHQTCAL